MALQALPLGARKARLSCSRVLCPRGFRGFRVLGLASLWVLLGSFVGCSRVILLGFRVLLGAFGELALVVPMYTPCVLRGALRFF
jgi:hypothetical protein